VAGITSVFQINRNLVVKPRITNMNANQRTVSEADLESEWVEIQAAQSNPAAFQSLYARYYESIYRFIHRRTNQEVLAAEICSDTFLKAMQKLPGYKYQGVPFSAWLFRIASNEVAQYFRTNAKNRTVSTEEHTLQDVVVEVAEEEDNEQLRQLLLHCLEDLRENDLEIIEMRFFEQRPFKEIAEILEISESNAKVRTYRVIDRLKKIMKKEM
jgi:RNA polymerase sigma-70 factor (ECF subfamily)